MESADEGQTGVEHSMHMVRSRSLASADIDDEDIPLFRRDTPLVADDDNIPAVNEDQPGTSAQADDPGVSSPRSDWQPAGPDNDEGAREKGSRTPEDLITQANGSSNHTRPKPAMQMTLDTSGASWNLQPGSNRGPAKKKAKTATSSESRQLAIDHFRTFTSASGTIAGTTATQSEGTDDEEASPSTAEDGRHDADERPQPTDEGSPPEQDELEEDDIGTISSGPAEAVRAGTASLAEEEEEEQMILTDRRKTSESEFASSLTVDMSRIKARCSKRTARPDLDSDEAGPSFPSDREAGKELEGAGIDHETEEAEKTLSRLVSKADFATMEVVGQFNVAFIIARRRHRVDMKGKGKATDRMHDDLMIIECVVLSSGRIPMDTDTAIANTPLTRSTTSRGYSRLRRSILRGSLGERDGTAGRVQAEPSPPRPRELNLTASDELLAIEHQEVLRFNGFEIEVDEDAQAGQRIKLVAMPVSKATKKTEFTMQGTLAQHWTCYLAYKPLTDLEELLFLLREHTGSGMMYVPIHCLFLCPLN